MGIRLILSQFYGYSKKRTIVREEVYDEETTSFSREFKLEAIRLLSKGKKTELKHHQRVGNKTKPVIQIERRNDTYAEAAFTGKSDGRKCPPETRVSQGSGGK
ncbi:hypothetical protein MNBD_GAMMA21-1484 [hydrothermal vent metagenome]|uniref:Uncharacterized protein n=1 Tax=hydrothermal vent metagenome TaxID=652676 RepID=A0A3B0ZPQ8_9ZZZZ